MPVATQLRSNLQANLLTNQTSSHDSSSNMPSAFNQNDKLANPANDTTMLFKPHIVDLIFSKIDELVLNSTLNLAKHLAGEILNLSAIYLFANVNEFCCTVAINRAKIFYSLARIIAYNVSINEKIAKQYME